MLVPRAAFMPYARARVLKHRIDCDRLDVLRIAAILGRAAVSCVLSAVSLFVGRSTAKI